METFTKEDLIFIGRGANSEVYRLKRPYQMTQNYICDVVVKIGCCVSAENYNRAIKLLKEAGLPTLAFAVPCYVDGQTAVILPNVNTATEVCVSPNTIRNGYCESMAESSLLNNPIEDIANFDNLLLCMSNIVNCTNGKGIGLDMDMIFFSVEKNTKCPNVYCKLVDIDAMLQDNGCMYKLFKNNVANAKEALTLFIQYFVSTEIKKEELRDKITKYVW